MDFVDKRFSDRVAKGFVGWPEWLTLEIPRKNGLDDYVQQWDFPRHRYEADYRTFDQESRRELLAFNWITAGRAVCFPFKDLNDFTVEDQVIGVGNGTSSAIQLIKQYSLPDVPEEFIRTRNVILAVPETLVVLEDEVVKAATIDRLTGLITPDTPWGVDTEIKVQYCEYDVKVRFAKDWYRAVRTGGEGAKVSIDLIEDKRPL